MPLDELMLKVGSYMAHYGNFEHKSSIKSLVYGVSESHLSEGRRSPRFEADQPRAGRQPRKGPFGPNRQEVYSSIIPAMNLLPHGASLGGETSEK